MSKFTQMDWNELAQAYSPGTPVTGEVTSCQMFGAFVRVDQFPQVTALLEIIHFGLLVDDPGHRIQFPADYPVVGSRIEARVLAWSASPGDVRLTQLQHLDWRHERGLMDHLQHTPSVPDPMSQTVESQRKGEVLP